MEIWINIRNKYPAGWVKESKFGEWFLDTHIWAFHVIKLALEDLERLMQPRQDHYATILDIGCGHGHSLLQLDSRFKPDKIIALDVDPRASHWSEPKAKQCKCQIEFLTNNAVKMDVEDATVDRVFCHQTFHHLVDQESAIKEFLGN